MGQINIGAKFQQSQSEEESGNQGIQNLNNSQTSQISNTISNHQSQAPTLKKGMYSQPFSFRYRQEPYMMEGVQSIASSRRSELAYNQSDELPPSQQKTVKKVFHIPKLNQSKVLKIKMISRQPGLEQYKVTYKDYWRIMTSQQLKDSHPTEFIEYLKPRFNRNN